MDVVPPRQGVIGARELSRVQKALLRTTYTRHRLKAGCACSMSTLQRDCLGCLGR